MGVVQTGEGTKEPWGTLRKLREYWGRMGTSRLPNPLLGHPKCAPYGLPKAPAFAEKPL